MGQAFQGHGLNRRIAGSSGYGLRFGVIAVRDVTVNMTRAAVERKLMAGAATVLPERNNGSWLWGS